MLPDWFQVYVGLEEAAALIRMYEVQFVPGLLQTADYARAVIRLGQSGAPEEEIERRVSLRMDRQRAARAGRAAPAVGRRGRGGTAPPHRRTRRDARPARALIEASKEPNITLQVMPFTFGGHAAESGTFTIMRFPELDLPDVVYVEQLTSAVYLDKREDAERYTEVMERLSIESESPERPSNPEPDPRGGQVDGAGNNAFPARRSALAQESARSNSQGACVELGRLADNGVAVRNSRQPEGRPCSTREPRCSPHRGRQAG